MDLLVAALGRGMPDQEGLDLERERTVAGFPPLASEEQVLAGFEPEHRERLETIALWGETKQDRIFVLHAPKLARHDQARHHRVAKRGTTLGGDAERSVIVAGEQDVVGHQFICSIAIG